MTIALARATARKKRTPTVRNVTDYWTTADGDDDYPALQRAVWAAEAGGPARVYIPGYLSLSKVAKISKPIHLFGDCPGASGLNPLPANGAIAIDSQLPVKLSGFDISYPSPAAAGTSAIYVDCTDDTGAGIYGNSSSIFRDLRVINADTSLKFNAAQAFVVDNFKSLLHGSVGISVSNVDWPDAGDAKVVNSYLQGRDLSTTLAGLQWTGDGAFSFNNNVCLTGQYGALVQLQAGAKTRQLFIQNNTIDGASISGVSFWPLGSVPVPFGGVIVTGNIFNLCHNGVSAPLPPIGKWIATAIISQNNWYPDGVTPAGSFIDASAITTLANSDNIQG